MLLCHRRGGTLSSRTDKIVPVMSNNSKSKLSLFDSGRFVVLVSSTDFVCPVYKKILGSGLEMVDLLDFCLG